MSSQKRLREQHAALAHHIEGLLGERCPCCSRVMYRGKQKNGRIRRDTATLAHDVPVAYGGNIRVWVYACAGCNGDQGDMPFWNWGMRLRAAGDGRADAVLHLAGLIIDWCAATETPRKFGRNAA